MGKHEDPSTGGGRKGDGKPGPMKDPSKDSSGKHSKDGKKK